MKNIKDLNLTNISAINAKFKNLDTQNLFIGNTRVLPPFSYQNITSASGIIPLDKSSIYFENYISYSLNSSNLPKFTLATGADGQQISLNLPIQTNGNCFINTSTGSFNLINPNNSNVDLQYVNNMWVQKGFKSPWFVNKQTGSKLVGTGSTGSPRQGTSISLSADGNTLAIGGYLDDGGVGATWIFVKDTTGLWVQQGSKLVGTGYIGIPNQGINVSLSADGNTLAIGGLGDDSGVGATWIFTRTGGIWTQQGPKIVGSGVSGTLIFQGNSVSLSAEGNTLAIGGGGDNGNVGATWIFTRNNGLWVQQGSKLVGSGNSGASQQGTSVNLSADGNTLAVGGDRDNTNIGATWIFTRTGSIWAQQGSKLVGTGYLGASVFQGNSVSLSAEGNTLAIGGPSDDVTFVGATWIFTRTGGIWNQQGSKLVGLGNSGGSRQGTSVSLSADGNTLAVGGPLDNSNVGTTWIFTRVNEVWTQQASKLVGSGSLGVALQGNSVSLSGYGNTLAVGGPFGSGNGATWIFN